MYSTKKEIVLTGYKNFWPTHDKEAYYLGPWCFSSNHKYEYSDSKRFNLINHKNSVADDVVASSSYIKNLKDLIVPKLSSELNRLTNSNKTYIYWETVLTGWLLHWLAVAYDRYSCLVKIRDFTKTNEGFFVKTQVVHNPRQFIKESSHYEYQGHAHNLLLFSDILSNLNISNLEIVTENDNELLDNLAKNKHSTNIKALIKDKIEAIFHEGTLSSITHVYGMSIIDKIKILIRIDPLYFTKRLIFTKQTFDEQLKYHIDLAYSPKNEFETIVIKILPKYLPTYLFEIYDTKSKPRFRITTHDFYQSPGLQKLAAAKEKGAKVIGSQHGASYGQLKSFPLGNVEIDLSSFFITWGWKEFLNFDNKRLIPLPSPLLSKKEVITNEKGGIILVGNLASTYLFRLQSWLLPGDILDYIKFRCDLINSFSITVIKDLTFRPYISDYGTAEHKLMSSLLKEEVKIDNKTDFWKQVQSSKLVIFDHISTGFLQLMAANFPVICVYSETFFSSCSESEEHLKSLTEAGIVFHDIKKAAVHINNLDVFSWWNDTKTQKARENYCAIYANSSSQWEDIWVNKLKTI